VNHPALVKTSDQPSFSSANFLPFTSAEALQPSAISPVPSLNLKPNPCGGTAKKIISSPYKKFVEATQKKKIKQATKSKTSWLASNALLGPSKRQKRSVCRDQTPSDTSSHSEQDADCMFCTGRFSEATMKKTRYDVRNVSDGRTHFVLVWGKILFVSLSGTNTVLFLVCILYICIF